MSYLEIALRAKKDATVQKREISAQSEIRKPTSDPFETPELRGNPILRVSLDGTDTQEPRVIEKTAISPVSKVPGVPTMPKGVRLIGWEPRPAPVAIDVCSVVVDVPKFIESELRALDSRLNNPSTIHGGFTVAQMLDRLAQAGLEVDLDPKGRANE
jgi:hypothetical protein